MVPNRLKWILVAAACAAAVFLSPAARGGAAATPI